MSKGIIIAGFGAIGKTTLGNKYKNVIDMESGLYRWDNTGFESIPYEERKGKGNRPDNPHWPQNYYNAIMEASRKYDVVLTSMYSHLLDYFEENNIEYYLAYPSLDCEDELEKRCYERGNSKVFIDKLKVNLYKLDEVRKKYHPKRTFILNKNEYLEDVLKNENII